MLRQLKVEETQSMKETEIQSSDEYAAQREELLKLVK